MKVLRDGKTDTPPKDEYVVEIWHGSQWKPLKEGLGYPAFKLAIVQGRWAYQAEMTTEQLDALAADNAPEVVKAIQKKRGK